MCINVAALGKYINYIWFQPKVKGREGVKKGRVVVERGKGGRVERGGYTEWEDDSSVCLIVN